MAITAVLFSLLAFGPAQAPAQTARQDPSAATAGQPATLEHGTDIIRSWRPQQHVYVKGNVGASTETLAALEQWLRAEATNWVVVLCENADGETWTDAEGHAYRGVEAVNQAMGKGLVNQTAFGQLTDPRTHEKDAAFFILFLKERNLSYYGSDAQDRRGLGEDNWKGNLDQRAVSAMRNGARVADAARDSIEYINRQLTARIVAEAESRKQRAAAELAARAQAIEQAKAALETAQRDYQLLESKSGQLARQSLQLTGDLAQPDLAGLRAELQTGKAALEQNDSARAKRAGEAVQNRAQALLKQLDRYGSDRKEIDALSSRLAGLKRRVGAVSAARQLSAALSALDQARLQYDRADSSYVLLLTNASSAVHSAESAIQAAEIAAARERLLLSLLGVSSFIALLALALFLNRRRAPAKKEARQLYDLWDHALGEKVNALFSLLDRRATFVGTSPDEAAQRYSGETLKIAGQLIQDVDELFIMSSCAGRVLQQAKALLEPQTAPTKVANLFFAGRYRQSIALLHDQPIAFKPEEGLELVVRGARTERDRLIGDLKSYEAFTMTFNQLVDAFNVRAQRALVALDQVESTLANAPELLRTTQTTLDNLRAHEAELTAGAAQDGWFGVRPVFERLIPSAQTALARAVKLGITDPVGALQTDGATARQQTADAQAIVELALEARQALLPSIRENVSVLSKSGLSCEWIRAQISELSAGADKAAEHALKDSAEGESAQLRQTRADIDQRVQKALELDKARREQSEQQITKAAASIEEARQKIGASLGKPAAGMLRENEHDPSDVLLQAQAQFKASFAALDRGDLEAAANAIEAVTALTGRVNEIVTGSLEALSKQQETVADLRKEWRRIGELIPAHAKVLAEIQGSYAAAVLDLDAVDPVHPEANRTVADNIEETETHLAAVRAALDKAEEVFPRGGLLESADLLRQAQGRLSTAVHRVDEVMEKQQRLKQAEAANRDLLQELEKSAAECGKSVEQATTMVPTQRAFEQTRNTLDEARSAVSAPKGNPFEASVLLLCAKKSLEAVADSARCDKDVFDQAGRSLAASESQLTQARRAAAQTAGDTIPDSAATRQAVQDIQSLEATLNGARQLYSQPHGDWHAVDETANGVAQRAAAATATLKGELERAQAAVASITAASTTVRNAGAWTGGFGVVIFGTPGSDVLTRARNYLERGDYEAARREAESARRAAERAIAQAEAELQQRRYAEEQRREAERRQRAAEEQSHSWASSSSSSHNSSSSSSWGSSGSGTSSSSFSSGSGVSTSSW